MYFFRRDASTDMQHDISGSRHDSSDLDLRSKFDFDFPRCICIYFDASRREEHDEVLIVSLDFLVEMLLEKKPFESFDL